MAGRELASLLDVAPAADDRTVVDLIGVFARLCVEDDHVIGVGGENQGAHRPWPVRLWRQGSGIGPGEVRQAAAVVMYWLVEAYPPLRGKAEDVRADLAAIMVAPHAFETRKRDGGYGYGATDLAAIRYRTQRMKATRLLYVVGSPQRQHFEMVFQTAKQAGWLPPAAQARHIGFGQVLSLDGKKSPAGETIKLADLVDEAIARALAAVQEKNTELDAETQAGVAQAVGIGAIK